MIVYRVTNTINGKVYIGKWEGPNVSRRWGNHLSRAFHGSKTYFHNSLRKYGAKAFAVEVLHHAKTREELCKMETFFIVLHQSHLKENGYNLTLGGDGSSGFKHTADARKKMSIDRQGRFCSSETREKIRLAKMGVSHPHRGSPKSEETRRKISVARKGKVVISEEQKQKISQSLLRGNSWTPERRKAQSERMRQYLAQRWAS